MEKSNRNQTIQPKKMHKILKNVASYTSGLLKKKKNYNTDRKANSLLNISKSYEMTHSNSVNNILGEIHPRRICESCKDPYVDEDRLLGRPLDDLVSENNNKLPSFIFEIVKYIEKYGLYATGVYRKSGSDFTIKNIIKNIKKFKTDEMSYCEESIHNLANVLKLFLKNLPGGLICEPQSTILTKIIRRGFDADEISKHLAELPLPNRSLLLIVLYHICEIKKLSETNKMDSYNMGVCFGPSLLPWSSDDDYFVVTYQNKLIASLIDNFSLVILSNKPYLKDIRTLIPESYHGIYPILD